MCSSLSCARCHAAAARGKHRPPRSQGAPPALIDTTPTPEEQLSSHDLTLADLEAMSPATWQRFVTWLLATEGYVRERELGEVAGLPLVLYRRTSAEPGSLHAQVTHAVPVVAVVSHRPTEADAWLDRGLLAQAESRAASADGAPITLITTARASDPATPFGGKSVMIRDRVALDSALNQLRSAYERQRTEHESEQRGRAEAAARVRVSLIDGLTQASVLLDSQEPVPASSAEASARHDDIRQRLAVVHQALAAIETLVAEWEGAFGPTAARDGSLPLLVSAAEYDALHARATHLVGVLAKATAALKAAEPPTDRSLDAWWDAVREEITLRMRSLAERCAALDPLAWQSFSQAHDTAAAARATDLLAASGRATLRASRLLDELASRAPAVRRVNQPRGQ
jgi:hypothetical protein